MNNFIDVSKELNNRGNPKYVKKICEWTGDEFWIEWKYRNARFKDIDSMYAWRKSTSREFVNCLNCGKEFERYKNVVHYKTGLPTQYCSNECNLKSLEKKEKLKKWANSDKNHWKNKKTQLKISNTKLQRYGDANYNNMKLQMETMMSRYGVPYATYLPQTSSNGKTISKGQRKLYEMILNKYSDAKLEYYLENVGKSVDIFIPSKNKIIEYFGDYWHCNPIRYTNEYYHVQIHKTAQEVWKNDSDRIQHFINNGYDVSVVWESELRSKNYKIDII
jgi:G:T-mismatch repair DNA endonuclease (very short patch repair protein)